MSNGVKIFTVNGLDKDFKLIKIKSSMRKERNILNKGSG